MGVRLATKVLLVGWDGAEWEIVRPLASAGRMPHLTRLIESGVSGDLAAVAPFGSPVGWTSLVTGKRPFRHGVLGHREPSAHGVRSWPSTSRGTNTLWEMLGHAGLRTHVVNLYASHPAEAMNGVCVSEGFAGLGATTTTVSPSEEGAGLAALWRRPEQIEWATLAELIPGAADAGGGATADDARIALARARLAETASVHAVATELVARRTSDFCDVLYRGIEQFSHLFQRYAPPRMADVSAAEHERFGGVVANVYALHDQMLGRLIELAGPETTVIVCSDHGFATGGRRTASIPRTDDEAATLSHRPHGLFVMAGPDVRRDDTIEGASVMDVAPTVLALLGLPVGDDMDGRPLVRALEMPESAKVETTPSWDVIRPLPPHAAEHTETAWEAAGHLLGLGLRGPHAGLDAASREAEDEVLFTLARAYLDAGRAARATPLLRVLAGRRPADVACHARLFDALYLRGRYAEARAMVDAAVARAGGAAPGPLAELGYAALDVAERHPAEALAHLARARDFGAADLPELHVLRGEAFLRLGRYAEADAAFGDALARDDKSERAWDGRAAARLGLRQYDDAAAAALRAVGARADHAPAHYHLGVALVHLGRFAAAATALTRATALRPDLLPAHRRLIELFEGPLGDPAAARERKLLIARFSARRAQARNDPAMRTDVRR